MNSHFSHKIKYIHVLRCWPVVFMVVLLYCCYNWFEYQSSILQSNKTSIEMLTKSLENNPKAFEIATQQITLRLDKISDDFNFNFITSFLATSILGFGVIVFLQITATHQEIENRISNFSDLLESINGTASRNKNKLRLEDADQHEYPIDFAYTVLKLQIYADYSHAMDSDTDRIELVCSALSRMKKCYMKGQTTGKFLLVILLERLSQRFTKVEEIITEIEELKMIIDGGAVVSRSFKEYKAMQGGK